MTRNHPSSAHKNLGTKTRKVWVKGLTDAARESLSDHDLKMLDLDIAYMLLRFEPVADVDIEEDLDAFEAELEGEQDNDSNKFEHAERGV